MMKKKRDDKTTSSSGNHKRKFLAARDPKHPMLLQNPKRGAPGFLMTCEQGKEQKCQREGLQMIQWYFAAAAAAATNQEQEQNSADNNNESQHNQEKTTAAVLSLEEELKQLQESKGDGSPSNFGIFQTGCRGTVFVLCTVPGSEMIPSFKEQKKQLAITGAVNETTGTDEGNTANDIPEDEPTSKKLRTDEPASSAELGDTTSNDAPSQALSTEESQNTATASTTTTPSDAWDPAPIVRQIFQDIATDSAKDAPSSRFVTRMIPMQVTCYTSEEEIILASRLLFQHYLPKSTKTFGIALKRRLCHEQLTKEKIINLLAKQVIEVVPSCKVQLDNPEITIVVEICKTLCGMSIVPNCHETFGNFNLAVAREKANPEDSDNNDE